MTAYNLLIGELGENEVKQLKPIPKEDDSRASVEAGTLRYGFSFYYDQPVVVSHSSLDTTANKTYEVRYYYSFRTIYPTAVSVSNYVDWVQVGDKDHNVGISVPTDSDDGEEYKIIKTMIKADAKFAENKSTVAYGESIFSTVEMRQNDEVYEDKLYTVEHAAATIVDVRSESETVFNNE